MNGGFRGVCFEMNAVAFDVDFAKAESAAARVESASGDGMDLQVESRGGVGEVDVVEIEFVEKPVWNIERRGLG